MKTLNLLNDNTKKNVGLIRHAAGFTLIEIMVVVIIIGTIAGLVGIRVFSRLQEAREEAALTQMNSFRSALDLFRLDNGFYPLTQQGLEALVIPPNVGRMAGRYRQDGYLNSKEVPPDPWGNPYGYNCPDGIDFQIWSAGEDEQSGTADDIVL